MDKTNSLELSSHSNNSKDANSDKKDDSEDSGFINPFLNNMNIPSFKNNMIDSFGKMDPMNIMMNSNDKNMDDTGMINPLFDSTYNKMDLMFV